MNTKQVYYLKKFAQAERTAKKAVETTVSHRSLSEFGAALGKQDHILYGRGSVVKNANVQKRAGGGAVGDFAADLGYTALNHIPYVQYVTAPANIVGATVGLAAPAEKLSKEFNPIGLIPGAGRARNIIRRRKRDKELSGGKRDRSAYVHEMAGSITNALLFGALGAGVGGIGTAMTGAGAQDIGDAAAMGALIGSGGSALAQMIGGIGGLFGGGSPKDRTKYLKGDNMWKNYFVPGYAGYQGTSALVDVLKNG